MSAEHNSRIELGGRMFHFLWTLVLVAVGFSLSANAEIQRANFESAILDGESGYYFVKCNPRVNPENEEFDDVVSTEDFLSGNFCPRVQNSNVIAVSSLGRNRFEVTCAEGNTVVVTRRRLGASQVCLKNLRQGSYYTDQSQRVDLYPSYTTAGDLTSVRAHWVRGEEIVRELDMNCSGYLCRGFSPLSEGAGAIDVKLRIVERNKVWLKRGFRPARIYSKRRVPPVDTVRK